MIHEENHDYWYKCDMRTSASNYWPRIHESIPFIQEQITFKSSMTPDTWFLIPLWNHSAINKNFVKCFINHLTIQVIWIINYWLAHQERQLYIPLSALSNDFLVFSRIEWCYRLDLVKIAGNSPLPFESPILGGCYTYSSKPIKSRGLIIGNLF